jgi:hypothetical protein
MISRYLSRSKINFVEHLVKSLGAGGGGGALKTAFIPDMKWTKFFYIDFQKVKSFLLFITLLKAAC